MVDISIVDGGYKLTYNWGVPHSTTILTTLAHQTGPLHLSGRQVTGKKVASWFRSGVSHKSATCRTPQRMAIYGCLS